MEHISKTSHRSVFILFLFIGGIFSYKSEHTFFLIFIKTILLIMITTKLPLLFLRIPRFSYYYLGNFTLSIPVDYNMEISIYSCKSNLVYITRSYHFIDKYYFILIHGVRTDVFFFCLFVCFCFVLLFFVFVFRLFFFFVVFFLFCFFVLFYFCFVCFFFLGGVVLFFLFWFVLFCFGGVVFFFSSLFLEFIFYHFFY